MKEIQKISITDAVVANIKEAIEVGEYEPGKKLPTEAALCDEMKVSRSSVREALRILQALGYVEIKPGRGAFVTEKREEPKLERQWFDVEKIKFVDFMEVRLVLENLAVRLAVERAAPKQIEELEQIHDSFCEACEKHELTKLIMLDEMFHTKIMLYTRNQLLINMNKELQDTCRVYRSESLMSEKLFDRAIGPHGKIVECFKNKDAKQAVIEMKRHLEMAQQDIIFQGGGKKDSV